MEFASVHFSFSLRINFAFVFLLLVITTCSCNNSVLSSTGECSKQESEALLSLKESVDDLTNALSSWVYGSNCCHWKGVGCDNLTGEVVRVDVRNGILIGTVDMVDFSQLKALMYLDLSFNLFEGVIPDTIGSLKSLKHLDLAFSGFSGVIPSQLANLSNLQFLDLTSSVDFDPQLGVIDSVLKSGSLSWLGNLRGLRYLSLSGIKLGMEGQQWRANIARLYNLQSLDLSSCNLSGKSPFDSLKNLTSLSYIYLGYNHLSSHIPSWFSNHTSLVSLHLTDCNMQGLFPPQLLTLPRLEKLFLRNNNFSGNIPSSSVANISSLTYLDLSANRLSGAIPPSLARHSSLAYLHLSDNQLSGGIPPSLARLSSLTDLDISNNELNGSIPITLFSRLSRLQYLDLSSNRLEGSISLSLFQSHTNLTSLSLSGNQLTVRIPSNWIPPFQLTDLNLSSCNIGGVIPPFISTQYNLTFLYLAHNNLVGSIPTWIWDLPLGIVDLSQNNLTGLLNLPKSNNITHVLLQSNRFKGFIPQNIGTIFPYLRFLSFAANNLSGIIPSSIGDMEYLEVLDLSDNKLHGRIPSRLGNCSNLEALKVTKNNLEGEIPMEIWNLSSLKTLHMNDNRFTGGLPLYLPNSKQLEILDVGNNRISGHLPTWWGSLSQLRIVVLRGNCLEGNIPLEMATHQSLQIIDLSQNKLSGPIPPNLAMLSALTHFSQPDLNMMQNSASDQYYTDDVKVASKGQLMDYSSILYLVTCIDVSQNKLTGTIPSAIGKLNGLITLNFSRNLLNGVIPDVFGNTMQLESLDLSHNQLSGKVPAILQMLGSLGFLNLSYNNLSGGIPPVRHLDTFGADSYVGNPNLCGRPLNKSCWPAVVPPTSRSTEDEDEELEEDDDWKIEVAWYGGLLLSHAMGFWGVFAIFLLNRKWRKKCFRAMDRISIRLGRKFGF